VAEPDVTKVVPGASVTILKDGVSDVVTEVEERDDEVRVWLANRPGYFFPTELQVVDV
jgi:hypothetical protein